MEIIVCALGTAASTGNTCESRASYTTKNIDVGSRFADALVRATDGALMVDKSQISKTLPEDPADLVLPQCF